MTSSRLAGLVVAAVAAAAGLVGVSSAPASAAVCSSPGITAVADYGDGAGGGTATACNKVSGSKNAAAVFNAVGFTMDRNPDGSVCKVNNRPANAPCKGLGTQYWGLWWSDGKGGGWTYAQQGVDTLSVPANGSVAWAWQGPSGRRQPSVAPARIQPTPTPTPKPTKAPPKSSSGGSGGGGGGGAKPTKAAGPAKSAATTATAPTSTPAPSASARAAAKAKVKARARARASARASAGASPSTRASESVSPPTADDDSAAATQKASGEFTPEEQDSGLPVWVPIVVLLGLGGAAGGAVWWRRRTGAA